MIRICPKSYDIIEQMVPDFKPHLDLTFKFGNTAASTLGAEATAPNKRCGYHGRNLIRADEDRR